MFIPSAVKIGPVLQNLKSGHTDTQTQYSDVVNQLFYFFIKESDNMDGNFLEKSIVTLLVKKLPTFHGT
jgi:hypothetical protein